MAPQSSNSTSAHPPLSQSVEQAYRIKCGQLKRRYKDVEEVNDATRLRLARLQRQIKKMRLERAFLLEQLGRRTSTNVEDSEGSPSPPPTPKEKTPRIKRQPRKAFQLDALGIGSPSAATSTLALAPLTAGSPSAGSDAAAAGAAEKGSAAAGDAAVNGGSSKGGGSAAAGSASAAATTATVTGKRPKNAFELFCVETRPHLEEKLRAQAAEEDADRTDEEGGGSGAAVTTKSVDNKLARAWKALSERERDEWERRSISLAAGSSGKVGGRAGGKKKDAAARSTATEKPAADNDDEEDEDMDDDADEGAGAGGDTTIAESARGDGDGDADEDVDMEAPDSSDEMRAPKRGA